MDKVNVVITKAEWPSYWYSGCIGRQFEVYDDRRDFIVAEDYDLGWRAEWRHIPKEDCEVIP